jgi:hypothetical protein
LKLALAFLLPPFFHFLFSRTRHTVFQTLAQVGSGYAISTAAVTPRQILMLRSRANAIETTDHRAQYVACLFFSRLLEGM